MKRHKYISLLIILGVAIPIITNAATLSSLAKRPLGGRVIRAGQNADIACSTISGPIFVRPFNIAVPGPFFVKSVTGSIPRSGKLILGNYSLVPDLTTCYNPETGVPIPAFEIKPYGVSR